jgi:uncharacterized protein
MMKKVYHFTQNKITASYVIRAISLLILPLLNLGGTISPVAAQISEDAIYKESSFGIYTGPIIDMHLHSYAVDDFWGPSSNPATGQLSVSTPQEHMERSIEIMRECNIVLGTVSGDSKESTNAWQAHAPGMILRGIVLADPSEFIPPENFKALIENGELDLLGEVAAQYVGLSPSNSAYSPYWEIAQEYSIPVGIHSGQSFPGTPYGCCPKFRLRYGNPLELEDMLVEFPDLKVYMMHAGGGGGPYSEYALMMMAMYPQLYVDVGVLSWLPGLDEVLINFLQQAKNRRVLDRVMFGSDQMVWPEAIGMAVDRINRYDFLTADEKADIFYNNAARFLGLSEEEIQIHQELITNSE